MDQYSLEQFMEDIETNREFEFTYNGKGYALTYSKEGYIFSGEEEKRDFIYKTYEDLLEHTRIQGKRVEQIIGDKLYEDLSIY